jgi:hypothetical protein
MPQPNHPPASPASPASPAYKNWLTGPVATTVPKVTTTSLSVAATGVASSTTGVWTGAPTGYTYQWLRDGANIAGATAASYTLVAADVGHLVSCTVTATGSGGTGTSTSNTVGPVVA